MNEANGPDVASPEWPSHPSPTMSRMEVACVKDKLAESPLHAAARLRGDCVGGATNLNRVLFFVEFTHLRRRHQLASVCQFQKLPQEPAPHQRLPVRLRLIDAGEAKLIEEDFLGGPQQRSVPERAADLIWFIAEESQTIEDMLDQLERSTGTQVSELSHQEPGWRLTETGETIPFSTAFLDCPQVATSTSERLSKSVAKRYRFATFG